MHLHLSPWIAMAPNKLCIVHLEFVSSKLARSSSGYRYDQSQTAHKDTVILTLPDSLRFLRSSHLCEPGRVCKRRTTCMETHSLLRADEV